MKRFMCAFYVCVKLSVQNEMFNVITNEYLKYPFIDPMGSKMPLRIPSNLLTSKRNEPKTIKGAFISYFENNIK
jgi:hypothetical protein